MQTIFLMTKNKLAFLVVLMGLFFASSCVKAPDEVFDKNPTERVNESISKAMSTILAHKEGWELEYYPSSDVKFGGYTIFAKFLSETQVTLTSDINSDKITSSYDIIAEAGPVLTFDGYNKVINHFTEPGKDNGGIGADDTGMKGDFEFSIQSISDTLIVLLGKKSHNIINMRPIPSEGYDAISEKYFDASSDFDDLREAQFKLIKGNDTTALKLAPKTNTFQLADDANSELLSFRILPDGLSFFKEYELAGTKFNYLSYVAPSTEYGLGYYTDAAKSFKIVPIPPPPPTLSEWFLDAENFWSFYLSGVGDFPKSIWQASKASLAAANYSLNYFQITTDVGDGTSGIMMFLNNATVLGVAECAFSKVPGTDDEVKISYVTLYNYGNFGLAHWNAGLSPMVTAITNGSVGVTYKITADQPIKPTELLLTDKSNPANTYKIILGDVSDPLNK